MEIIIVHVFVKKELVVEGIINFIYRWDTHVILSISSSFAANKQLV